MRDAKQATNAQIVALMSDLDLLKEFEAFIKAPLDDDKTQASDESIPDLLPEE